MAWLFYFIRSVRLSDFLMVLCKPTRHLLFSDLDSGYAREMKTWVKKQSQHIYKRHHAQANQSDINATDAITHMQQNLTFTRQHENTSAAVLLAVTDEDNPRVLLTRRAAHLKNHAGQVSLPGGKRDPDDTSNIYVALREAHEETGIHPFDVTLLGDLPVQKALSGMLVTPVVGLIPPDVSLTPEEGEIARIFWADLTQLTPEHIVPYQIDFKGMTVNTPSFQVDGEVVWGLTGRILASFLNQTFGYDITWSFVMR